MRAPVRTEGGKRPVRFGILGIGKVGAELPIDAAEHGLGFVHELAHGRAVGAKDEVLAVRLHVLLKDDGQPVRLLEGVTQGIQIAGGGIAGRLVFGGGDAAFVLFEVLPAGIEGGDVGGRQEDAAHDRLPQRHLRGDVALEELVRHVALTVQIADVGGRKTQKRHLGPKRQEILRAPAPLPRPRAMKLVEDDVVGRKRLQLLIRKIGELGIGIKEDVFGRKALLFCALELGFKDDVARGEPKDAAFRVVLREAEGDERLARSRGVDDGGATRLRHESRGAAIGFLVVRIELERHLPFPRKRPSNNVLDGCFSRRTSGPEQAKR